MFSKMTKILLLSGCLIGASVASTSASARPSDVIVPALAGVAVGAIIAGSMDGGGGHHHYRERYYEPQPQPRYYYEARPVYYAPPPPPPPRVVYYQPGPPPPPPGWYRPW
ncbi:hypothetical protein [Pseudomonas sp. KNUC1026]|uniref:hypothetical protein n=1 Tax=Pseudomonas sp. KNUC1026 TaxID=2893890 RepID=UPI001F16686B|nr:hypothetical protein [Pseudomonas sp. KNUC1026]UFH49195.1 hypothetical protein LN139_20220 [Pseudomonas sp. KNUC1026]